MWLQNPEISYHIPPAGHSNGSKSQYISQYTYGSTGNCSFHFIRIYQDLLYKFLIHNGSWYVALHDADQLLDFTLQNSHLPLTVLLSFVQYVLYDFKVGGQMFLKSAHQWHRVVAHLIG